jgi:heme exporter protein A
MISHQVMLYRDLTPLENLRFFARLYHVRLAAARARELLDSVGLADRARDPVRTLSRGMAQRVAIARALVHEPELLLADEPFTGLDQASSVRLEECLRSLHAAGRTLIVAHHDLPHAVALCQRALVISAGRIVVDASSDRVADHHAVLSMAGCK